MPCVLLTALHKWLHLVLVFISSHFAEEESEATLVKSEWNWNSRAGSLTPKVTRALRSAVLRQASLQNSPTQRIIVGVVKARGHSEREDCRRLRVCERSEEVVKRELSQQVTGNPHWVLLPKVTLACHSTFRCPGVETGYKGEDSFALELSIFSQSGTGAARTKGYCLCGWSQIPNKC